MIDQQAYFERIGYHGAPAVTAPCLRQLHARQVMSVPFEDLDIHEEVPLSLALPDLFDKVVQQQRGGFCYELNYLFASLLRQLGFEVTLLSARIFNLPDQLGPPFDHLVLLVSLASDRYLLDVGYGDLFIEPLRWTFGITQRDQFHHFQLREAKNCVELWMSSLGEADFELRYIIDTRPRRIEDFAKACHDKQHDADSYFVQNRLCTLPTPKGRITLFNDTFTERIDGQKHQEPIKDEQHFRAILRNRFGIVLDA